VFVIIVDSYRAFLWDISIVDSDSWTFSSFEVKYDVRRFGLVDFNPPLGLPLLELIEMFL
jgi:hypothetical protein